MKITKTNAMRILDKNKIKYNIFEYEVKDGEIDGISVALKTGKNIEEVFKTLVTQGSSKNFYVFCIPVYNELDLKKAANSVNEKSIEMINPKDLMKITGYIRGGCSPIGMKKLFTTVFDETINSLKKVTVSAGKIGHQIEITPQDLIKEINGITAAIVK